MAKERTIIGGDVRGIPALRVTVKRIMSALVSLDPLTGEVERSLRPLATDEWPEEADLSPSEVKVKMADLQTGNTCGPYLVAQRLSTVVCLHQELRKIFFFCFEDDEQAFVETVEAHNRSLRSVRFLD